MKLLNDCIFCIQYYKIEKIAFINHVCVYGYKLFENKIFHVFIWPLLSFQNSYF